MNIIGGITSQPKQQMTIVLDDGTRATWLLEYRPNQSAWFYSLTWGTVVLNNQRLVASPNIVRQVIRQIPFGITIITAGNVEPVDQEGFVNGSVVAYLLNAQDVADIEAQVFPGL